MHKRTAPVIVAAAIGLFALLVGGAGAATKTSSHAPTLSIQIDGEPPTLDATKTASILVARIMLFNVLETLVQVDPHRLNHIEPLLAQSWTVSKDRKVYTFVLRQGATFSTGAPVTAADVVFSLKYMAAPGSAQSGFLAVMKSVKALNKQTVQIVLSRPSNSFLSNLSYRAGMIFSKATYPSLATDPIGSGPFKIATWDHGAYIELVPNPYYSGPYKPYLKQVYFKFLPQAAQGVTALRAGQVDVLQDLIARDQGPSLAQAGYVVSPDASPRVCAMFLNTTMPPLNDLRIRQALSYAVDKKSIANALTGGVGVPVGTWISRGVPYYFKFEDYPYDVAKAKQLLAAAGYPNGLTLPMTVIANNISSATGELLALQLAQAGIKLNLQTDDLGTFLSNVLNGRQYTTMNVCGANPASLQAFFADGHGWATNWNSPQFNADIAAADTATTQKQSNNLYRAAVKVMAAAAPIVALYNDVNLTVRPKNLLGWVAFRVDQAIDLRHVRWAG